MIGFREWVREHDDRWSFIAFYVGGAVVLSIVASLFWVGLLMFAHFLLELTHHLMARADAPVRRSVWNTKFDLGLFMFALVIVLYADTVLAALGIGQAARAVRGAQAVARVGIIERAMRIFFLTIDDVARVVLSLGRTARGQRGERGQGAGEGEVVVGGSDEEDREDEEGVRPWRKLGKGDCLSLGFGGVCLVLVVIAPWLAGLGSGEAMARVMGELKPW